MYFLTSRLQKLKNVSRVLCCTQTYIQQIFVILALRYEPIGLASLSLLTTPDIPDITRSFPSAEAKPYFIHLGFMLVSQLVHVLPFDLSHKVASPEEVGPKA